MSIDFDLFVVKFDSAGEVIWAKEAKGVYDDICSSLTIDAQDNIYLSGSFVGELFVGNGIQIATPGFKENLFLIKYASDGDPVWARALDISEFNDISLGLDIKSHEQTVGMTGYFQGVLKLDEFEISAQSDGFNGFAASFGSNSGDANWLRLLPGESNLISTQIVVDKNGRFTLGGYFDSTADQRKSATPQSRMPLQSQKSYENDLAFPPPS